MAEKEKKDCRCTCAPKCTPVKCRECEECKCAQKKTVQDFAGRDIFAVNGD